MCIGNSLCPPEYRAALMPGGLHQHIPSQSPFSVTEPTNSKFSPSPLKTVNEGRSIDSPTSPAHTLHDQCIRVFAIVFASVLAIAVEGAVLELDGLQFGKV